MMPPTLHILYCFFASRVGRQKEELLVSLLKKANVPHLVEQGIRHLGYPKTPDILFPVPVALDGFVVNWIESKAFFGDIYIHEKYSKNQYWTYHNRFGPGLVIYWFGYIAQLGSQKNDAIMVRESLPTAVTMFQSDVYDKMQRTVFKN